MHVDYYKDLFTKGLFIACEVPMTLRHASKGLSYGDPPDLFPPPQIKSGLGTRLDVSYIVY